MGSLSKENRKLLENTVAAARVIAVKGATTVLRDQYAVGESAPWPHMSDLENKLRVKLRAHGRQLGDRRGPRDTQELDRLAQACAYEHWHRMLFARFLAENDLLLDPDHGVAMTLEEIRELAQEQHRDWQELAAELAQRMLLAVFRPEDPVLSITLPPETRLQLEEKLALLPTEVFLADDSLGWVYQFWQRDEKDRVNKSEVKIGADELPAVTQLFTEDYMVLFLLENTLGAWWTAKRRAEGKDPVLPGYTFSYLRLNEDGSPSAGSFDGWPRTAKELRILDPCMGSGHFLTFALPILARMRMEEEDGLQLKDALTAVLKQNVFGLEIDERCAQIAAFNLALTAWRMAGEHIALPELNLACCGIGPNATKEQWIKLGEEIAARGGMPANVNLFGAEDSLLSEPVKRTMESLHELFSQAPVLGSLINPANLRVDLFQSDYKTVAPLLSAVLEAQHATEETRERVIAAAGMVKAATFLAAKYTLVATNVPYLGRGKQSEVLADFCALNHPDAKADLATCFVDRCLRFCQSSGTIALVTPQNWLFLTGYRNLRKRCFQKATWNSVARLGSRAFDTITGEIVNVALLSITFSVPKLDHSFCAVDVGESRTTIEKSSQLRTQELIHVEQTQQLANPDHRLILDSDHDTKGNFHRYVDSFQGAVTGDLERFTAFHWEMADLATIWEPFRTAVGSPGGNDGLMCAIRWEGGSGDLDRYARETRYQLHDMHESGQKAWGKRGIAINRMKGLYATAYEGVKFDNNVAVLIPHDQTLLLPIMCFCESEEFVRSVRNLDQTLKVTNQTLRKVSFEASRWKEVASRKYPDGAPCGRIIDPKHCSFNGHPVGSDAPLLVAVARLVGHNWPRQIGINFPEFPAVDPDGLESFAADDGIVPLSSITGAASAADRLRTLLTAAYGAEWSAAKLTELLGENESLESWLRDRFFEEHCQVFQQRPFVWHVWDGRKDGFHALLNYRKLAAPNGEGRKTLEKLIYTTLGDWITRQRADVTSGIDGADGRLAAADHLKSQLEKILVGEKPYDVFVRWKPLDQQPIGWAPDSNDGVRMNIRPWLTATPHQSGRRDGCILRVTPKIKYGKDRGKEPLREKEDFPWFWTWDERTDDFVGGAEFDGARWNDPHYSLSTKQKARDRKMQLERA